MYLHVNHHAELAIAFIPWLIVLDAVYSPFASFRSAIGWKKLCIFFHSKRFLWNSSSTHRAINSNIHNTLHNTSPSRKSKMERCKKKTDDQYCFFHEFDTWVEIIYTWPSGQQQHRDVSMKWKVFYPRRFYPYYTHSTQCHQIINQKTKTNDYHQMKFLNGKEKNQRYNNKQRPSVVIFLVLFCIPPVHTYMFGQTEPNRCCPFERIKHPPIFFLFHASWKYATCGYTECHVSHFSLLRRL